MKGKLQFDLRRNFGAAGTIGTALKMVGLAALTMLALAAPAFAQSSLDDGTASVASADVASIPATSAPDAASADAGSDTFAPAMGAAIVAPDSGYSLPPPDAGSLADPALSASDAGTEDAATGVKDAAIDDVPAADDTAGDALPSSMPPIDLASPLGAIAPIAAADGGSGPASHSGWDRVGDTESDTSGSDAGNPVLEVPRAVPSPDASAQGGDAGPPNEIGSVDDYQDEQDNPMAIYIPPPGGPPLLNPPFAASTFGNQPATGASVQPGIGPMLPAGVGGVRPFAGGMNSAIMPTSPMYPRAMPMMRSYRPMERSHRPIGPRSSAPIPGGWWNRAR